MKFLASLILALSSVLAFAQTPTHTVTLTVTDADTSAANPGTATIYKASGACPTTGVPSGAAVLTSTVAIAGTGTYADSNVIAGNTYCYYATVTLGGQTSGNSNTFQGAITIVVPVLSGVVH